MKKSILALFVGAQLLALAIAQDSGIFEVTGGQQYLAVAANATQVVAPEFQPPSAAIFSVLNVSTSGNSTTLNLAGDPPLDAYNAPILADQYNKKVYPIYYVLVTDGLSIGSFYSVVSNNATQIVIDTQGETLSSTSIKSIDLRPYWTLETLFPASGAGAAFIATTSDSNIMTQLVLSPTTITDGQNPQSEGQKFYFSSSVGNWVRDTEPTISAGAVPVPPSRYLYLQNTGTGSFPIDSYFAGTVLKTPFRVALYSSQNQSTYTLFALPRASSYKLSEMGFDTANFSTTDLLLVGDAQAGVSQTYYKAGANWYALGSQVPVDPTIPSGTAYAVKKAINAAGNKNLLNINNIGTSKGTSSNTAVPTGSTTSRSLSDAKTVAEVKAIVSNKIQAALDQGSPSSRSASDVATILGVSTSNLSKALKLAPASIKSSKGKINLSKFKNFVSKNFKAANLLAGKSTRSAKKAENRNPTNQKNP
jgi:uncharacterized protein (TIGR02597 family)